MRIISATMSGIILSLLPVVASPMMGQYISANGAPVASRDDVAFVLPDPKPIPFCQGCGDTQSFSKEFGDQYSLACNQLDSIKAYRWGIWYSHKHVCNNGSWWTCSMTTNNNCIAFSSSPTCPTDTSAHNAD